jgi:hypothetical protein
MAYFTIYKDVDKNKRLTKKGYLKLTVFMFLTVFVIALFISLFNNKL